MKRLSIKMRVTLWFTAALFLLTSLAIALILPISRTVQQNASHQHLTNLVDYSTRFIEVENGMLRVSSGFMPYIDGVYLLIYAQDRAVLAGSLPPGISIDDDFEDFELRRIANNGAQFYLYDRKVALPGFPQLWVRGCVPTDAANNLMLLSAGLIILPILALLAALGGYVLTRRAFSPVSVLVRTAEEISGGGDLSRRIALSEGNDELHKLAETFNEMIARLEASFETERQFAADASHELRTPLSVIISQCEYSLSQSNNAEYSEAVEVIKRQAEKMQKIIESLLLLARMEQGAEMPPMQKIDLSELLAELCADFALTLGDIALERDIEPGIFVSGDADLLMRMGVNLLGNAAKYGRAGGHIRVSLSARDGRAELRVRDDGIGIASDDIDKIWNRFYQGDPSRTTGTGLGLSMVRSIAELLCGTATVESEEGKGSEFTVLLPLMNL